MVTEKFVIIGSNCFTGASFSAHLLEKGFEVAGISRSSEPPDCFLPYKWIPHDNFHFHKYDLNHQLDNIMAFIEDFRPDYIVNFAAQGMVPQSWSRPEQWFQTNVVAMAQLHDRLRHCHFLKKYVHASTPEVYGSTSGLVKEDASYNPSTPYAVSKAACDMSLMSFLNAYRFPVALTRVANVCGPGQQLYRILPRTILSILLGRKVKLEGGGQSVRSFIHIRDVAEGTLRVARNGQVGGIYHLSTDRQVSIRELVEKVCSQMGVAFEDCVEMVDARMGEDLAYRLDCTKAMNELGWSPEYSLEEIINETIEWMRKNWEVIKRQSMEYIHKP